MAIRFTDVGAIRAQLAASLDGASSVVVATNTAPPTRTGFIGSQLANVQSAMSGVFAPASAVSGAIATSLDGCKSSIVMSETPPVSVLAFPRVMLCGVGGDQSYGSNSSTGFPAWTTAAAGSAANTAVQTIGAYDIAVIAGVFEGWDSSGARDRENLTQAIAGGASYLIAKNTARPTKVFYYEIMNVTVAGNPYAQWQSQVTTHNWFLYPQPAGGGTATSFINYSTAWPGAIGNAGVGASICGSNYGTTSSGSPTGPQGPARTFGNYAAIKLLMRGYTGDPRFSFNPQMGSPSAAGIFLDECFVAIDGDASTGSASLDGVTIAPGTQQGGGFPGLDTVQPVMARGNHNMFDQMQTMLSQFGTPGKIYYNFANFGQYANKYQFGTAPLTCGLENTLHGGLIENVIGSGASALECFQRGNFSSPSTPWPSGALNILDIYYQGMDFCLAPKMVGVGVKLPSADGTVTSSWPVGAGTTLTTVTAGSALEYQEMRYGLAFTLMDDGYFAPGCTGYDWSKPRWYDEYGDDSLVQVNVKRGYLGTPLTKRPTTPQWNQGPMGVWWRAFTGGGVVWNPRGNGAQTITLPQQYQALTGTQQPSVNNGALVSSLTIPDGDGRIFILPTNTFALTSLITGINNGLTWEDDTGGTNQPTDNNVQWLSDSTGPFARISWVKGGTAGLRWKTVDQTLSKNGLYLKYDIRRTQSQNSKEIKLFGHGYSSTPSIYSNFTGGCNAGGYNGQRMSLSYSDAVSGGDINTCFWLDAAPALTGGSAYTRAQPTINVHVGGTQPINNTWMTIEWYIRHNTDGVANGEMACWLNGALIFWAVNVFNCRTGGQGFERVDCGGYAPTAGTILDCRAVYANYSRPVGRGI